MCIETYTLKPNSFPSNHFRWRSKHQTFTTCILLNRIESIWFLWTNLMRKKNLQFSLYSKLSTKKKWNKDLSRTVNEISIFQFTDSQSGYRLHMAKICRSKYTHVKALLFVRTIGERDQNQLMRQMNRIVFVFSWYRWWWWWWYISEVGLPKNVESDLKEIIPGFMVNLAHFCSVIRMEMRMLLLAIFSPFVVLLQCCVFRWVDVYMWTRSCSHRSLSLTIISGIIFIQWTSKEKKHNTTNTHTHLVCIVEIFVWNRTYVNAYLCADVMAFSIL